MDRPVVGWARGWVRVPELRLQQKTARVIEAAGIGDSGRVVATQRVLKGAALLGKGKSGAREEKRPECGSKD